MKYCEFCGKQLENKESCSCPEAISNAAKKGQKKKLFFFGWIVIAAIIVLAAIFSAISITSKTDPFDHLSIEFSGYNTNGEANISFDSNAVIESIIGEEPEDPEAYFEWLALYDSYATCIDISHSEIEGLSNGDSITVKITAGGIAESKITSCLLYTSPSPRD